MTMKAVPFYQHGSVDVLRYQDFPEPKPARGQVIIDVEYCGVNHLDVWTRMGIANKKIRLPHICGCDIVGTVNKSTAGFEAGERVMVYPGASCGKCIHCKAGRENLCSQFAIIGGMSDYDGGYAERVAIPARNVIRIGKKMDFKTAATLAVSYLTAWNMLSANGAKKGMSLLVYGATSGIGMATIQLARALGVSTIITTAAGPRKAEFGEKLGAHEVIDRYKTKDISGEILARLGTGVDIVIDHVGAATWQTSIASLKPGGKMAVCGMTSGNEATVPVRTFYSKQVTMTGALMGTKAQLLELLEFVQETRIKPVIDSVFSLKDAREAQDRMEKDIHAGKILLSCCPCH
jgi:NADPH:quinone reductase-like Zn-dependent oxidoreductase